MPPLITASAQSRSRLARTLYWMAVTAMAALPLALVIAYDAEVFLLDVKR